MACQRFLVDFSRTMAQRFEDAETWKLVRDVTLSAMSRRVYRGFDATTILQILCIKNIYAATETELVDLWVYMYYLHGYMDFPEFFIKNEICIYSFMAWLNDPENSCKKYGSMVRKIFLVSDRYAKKRIYQNALSC